MSEERVCLFFGGQALAGCWDRYDPLKGESYNRDDVMFETRAPRKWEVTTPDGTGWST